METQTRYYTERSNARRAARAAGIDPDQVFETEEGFTFAPKSDIAIAATDPLDIPPTLKFSAEERQEGWATTPPKATPIKETTMAKAKAAKTDKKPRGASGAEKTETLLKMLKGKGATVEDLCKATGWLPHTLRARLSTLAKPKKDGGMGLKFERERVDGVTSYKTC